VVVVNAEKIQLTVKLFMMYRLSCNVFPGKQMESEVVQKILWFVLERNEMTI